MDNLKRLPDIYVEAQMIEGRISRMPFTLESLEQIKGYESHLEQMSATAFAHEKVKDIINAQGLGAKRLASANISKITSAIIVTTELKSIQLTSLRSFTDEVFENIKHFPTVQAVCGDPDNEDDVVFRANSINEFKNGLALFVARQILITKYRLNSIVNKRMEKVVSRFLDLYDGERAIYSSIHQAANKLLEGGLPPKEVKQEIVSVIKSERNKLAEITRKIDGGYLKKIADRVKAASDKNVI